MQKGGEMEKILNTSIITAEIVQTLFLNVYMQVDMLE